MSSDTKTASFINDLTEGPVAKKLLYFALPFMLSNLLQTVYNMVDMSVVGHYVGSAGMSAVSVGGRLVELLTLMCTGFVTGGQILLSQQVGARQKDAMQKTIGTLFTFILLVAVLAAVICIAFHRTMLTWMNTPAEAFEQAASYMSICSLGLFFVFGYNALCAVLRGMGDSKRPLLFVAVSSIVNLILDLIFVAGLGLGAAGAAAATAIAQFISFITALVFLIIRRESFGFTFSRATLRIDGSTLKTLTKLGLPLALQHAAITVSMLFVNSFINSYGAAASAVYGAGTKLQNIPSIITGGLSMANASMVGQNMAAGKPERVRKSVRTCFVFAASVYGIFIFLCLTVPRLIFMIFTTDPEVLELAPIFLRISSLGFAASIFNSSFNSVINGIGFTSLSMTIGLLDGVVGRICFSLLFGLALGMGFNGFLLGNSLAIWITAILATAYYFSGKWKTRRLAVHH